MQLSVACTLLTQSPRRVFHDFFTAVHGIFSSRSAQGQEQGGLIGAGRQGAAEGRGVALLLLLRTC